MFLKNHKTNKGRIINNRKGLKICFTFKLERNLYLLLLDKSNKTKMSTSLIINNMLRRELNETGNR